MADADRRQGDGMAPSTATTTAQVAAPTGRASPTAAANRARRQQAALPIAELHDGVATRSMLREAGLTRTDIKVEVSVGRWTALGRHTIGITVREPVGPSRWWWAVWNPGRGRCSTGSPRCRRRD